MKAGAAFLVSLLVYAAVVIWARSTFPDRVPVHWGGGGDADRVMSRDRAVVELVVIGGLLALLLGGAAASVRRLPMSLIKPRGTT